MGNDLTKNQKSNYQKINYSKNEEIINSLTKSYDILITEIDDNTEFGYMTFKSTIFQFHLSCKHENYFQIIETVKRGNVYTITCIQEYISTINEIWFLENSYKPISRRLKMYSLDELEFDATIQHFAIKDNFIVIDITSALEYRIVGTVKKIIPIKSNIFLERDTENFLNDYFEIIFSPHMKIKKIRIFIKRELMEQLTVGKKELEISKKEFEADKKKLKIDKKHHLIVTYYGIENHYVVRKIGPLSLTD